METSNPIRIGLAAFGLCLAAVLFGQFANDAYNGELAGAYDEPAHYVTTLLVRQFALDPFQSPMAFAENYYLHYPKIGLGHWPPMLYVVLAAWSIPFGSSQASMLVCMAVIAAGAGALLFSLLRETGGAALAAGVTLLWLLQPFAQYAAAMVMSEALLILLTAAAVGAFGMFLRHESWRWAAVFGLTAAAAILTKGTAVSLALVPPLAVLLSGRFRLLRNWRFWLPAVIVVVLAGPWYALADSFIPSAHGTTVTRAVSLARVDTPAERATTYFTVGGSWISSAVAGGWLAVLAGTLLRRLDPARWAAPLAFVAAACATHFALPESQSPRHLAYALPVALAVFGGALGWLSRLPGAAGKALSWGLLLAVLTGFGSERFTVYQKPTTGMREAWQALDQAGVEDDAVILVNADSREEGAFIAEAAEARPVPGPIVLRASKMFASSSWGGWSYRLRMDSADEIAVYLRRTGVERVVLGGPPPERASQHYHLVRQVVESRPAEWKAVFEEPGGRVRVFEAVGGGGEPREPIRIDMGSRLHKTLELDPPR